ncbi:uroporphyrinogen-III synthase [Niveispirillum sp. KHB5.9]|uniref:uroporphyrinogen-III synthase n=1 Tax=Niveispirillum sp. KHB5.9 TaxID=3400269 RepID=UPI003A8B0A5D
MTGVLVTRPEPGAAQTAASLSALGYHPILAPVLTIEPIPGPPIDLSGFDAVAVTSANGVRALAARTADRGRPLYAVGARTAALARDLGFTDVHSADGDVASLSALLAGKGHVLHVAGVDVAGELAPADIVVTRLTAYQAVAAKDLPVEALDALRGGLVAYVTLFSPRTADLFVRLAQKAGLSPLAGGWTALCLSAAVAQAASGFGFTEIRIAARPDAASLLALLPAVKGEFEA